MFRQLFKPLRVPRGSLAFSWEGVGISLTLAGLCYGFQPLRMVLPAAQQSHRVRGLCRLCKSKLQVGWPQKGLLTTSHGPSSSFKIRLSDISEGHSLPQSSRMACICLSIYLIPAYLPTYLPTHRFLQIFQIREHAVVHNSNRNVCKHETLVCTTDTATTCACLHAYVRPHAGRYACGYDFFPSRTCSPLLFVRNFTLVAKIVA